MSAHTPGPWSVSGSTGFVNQIAIEPAIGCVYGVGGEVKANARLFAAAPDLLYACIEGLELLHLRGFGDGPVGDLMRAAIANGSPA